VSGLAPVFTVSEIVSMSTVFDLTDRSLSPAIQWDGQHLTLLDQRKLPGEVIYLDIPTAAAAADAIRDMVVRGAPAIGITAAYGVALAARAAGQAGGAVSDWAAALSKDLEVLAASRPTAVNLFWAIKRMRGVLAEAVADMPARLVVEAEAIHREDLAANQAMGDFGATLIAEGSGVLTHCNAGALATGGYGTALGVIRSAWRDGRLKQVFADETRPWLQGARLTAWELLEAGIPVNLVADGASAWLMKQGQVQAVVVGSDRIAANGDVANKIGTYAAALAARAHGVRFIVAAPISTIDPETPDGASIPIETRTENELLELSGCRVAAPGAHAWNPVFDVTPANLVDFIVTEHGIIERPDRAKIAAHLASAAAAARGA
jgi:methylthioribose-1-phosphate isomerase